MSNYQIQPVSSRVQLNTFLKLPWSIYEGDENWVPPLLSSQKEMFNTKNYPFYQFAEVQPFLCLDNKGRAIGRICAILNNNHLKFHEDGRGFFGFLEAIDNPQVFKLLLDTAGNWLREKGCTNITGPANFSTNEETGLLIEGFDGSPVIMMTYNPLYYQARIEEAGFSKAKDLYAYLIKREKLQLEKLERVVGMLAKRKKATVRTLDFKNINQEIALLFDVYNQAWEKNWGFVPMTDAEFEHSAKMFANIAVKDFVLVLEVEGRPVGFSLAMPDYNIIFKKMNGRMFPFGFLKFLWYKNKLSRLRVIAMGLLKDFRGMGLDSLLYFHTIKRATELGYSEAELSWVLEDNVEMTRMAERLGGECYRKYRLFERVL